MNGEATELAILTFVLILVRVATFFSVLPFFGRKAIPSLILIGMSLALTNLEFWNLPELPKDLIQYKTAYLSWFGFAIAAATEFFIGALLGLGFGMFLYPIQIAGAYLAQEMGLNMATMTDASTQSNSDVAASLLQTLGLLLFFTLNLHHFIIFIINHSFRVLPIGQGFDLRSMAEFGKDAFASTEANGLSLIAPIGICLFVVLIILILLTKAAPTMNIFSIGLSIRIGAGLFFIYLFFPQMMTAIHYHFENVQQWIGDYLMSFRG